MRAEQMALFGVTRGNVRVAVGEGERKLRGVRVSK